MKCAPFRRIRTTCIDCRLVRQVFEMFVDVFGEYHDVINVAFAEWQIMEHYEHNVAEHGWCLLQSERHFFEPEVTFR